MNFDKLFLLFILHYILDREVNVNNNLTYRLNYSIKTLMIERVIKRKVEEARNQGWKQRVLARFLDTSFRIARACGLTDINSALLETPTTKEDSLWSAQIERLINLGFHAELGMSEDNYRASIPAFNPQPERFRGRFAIPVLVDPRVSLQRQLELISTSRNYTLV